MSKIIARTAEIEVLERKFRSKASEFVIVYGRRRIGKTYLVNNVFANRFTFSYVGARKQKPQKQLQRFAEQLKIYSGATYAPTLSNWDEAFNALRTLIDSRPNKERKVIFFTGIFLECLGGTTRRHSLHCLRLGHIVDGE